MTLFWFRRARQVSVLHGRSVKTNVISINLSFVGLVMYVCNYGHKATIINTPPRQLRGFVIPRQPPRSVRCPCKDQSSVSQGSVEHGQAQVSGAGEFQRRETNF